LKVAIISDTHDGKSAIKRTLEKMSDRGVDLIVHCGDICSPATVELFERWETVFVFGNGDTRRKQLRQAISRIGGECFETVGEVADDGKRLCFMHGHNKAMLLHRIHSFQYDYVAYGHSHKADEGTIGPTFCINPGSLCDPRTGTFAVLDMSSGCCEIANLSNSHNRGNHG